MILAGLGGGEIIPGELLIFDLGGSGYGAMTLCVALLEFFLFHS